MHVMRAAANSSDAALPNADAIEAAAAMNLAAFDAEHGGFGRAPKFPRPVVLQLLLRYHRRTGDANALRAVEHTLERMHAGGVYDHVGGGFHRYSTDARWLVPHFEKMLYDNAQLAAIYVEAWQATQKPEYARIARETLDYMDREMSDAHGGFHSATDAGLGELRLLRGREITSTLSHFSASVRHSRRSMQATERGGRSLG
jgi:uncharacterized protein YyaL (SSP411 family)